MDAYMYIVKFWYKHSCHDLCLKKRNIGFQPGECKYIPHVALKMRNLMDVLKRSNDPAHVMYMMECANGEMNLNLLADSDPIANDLGELKFFLNKHKNLAIGDYAIGEAILCGGT